MINDILASWMPGPIELVIVLVVFFFSFVAPLVGVIVLGLVVLVSKDQERNKLRRQVQELTEEVARLKRQQE